MLPFDEYVRSLDRKRTFASVLFRADADRVLLVEPSYKEHWELPGGAVEAGESPWAAARREVWEELGVECACERLLVIDHVPEQDGLPEGLGFVFDGGLITPAGAEALRPAVDELLSAGLFDAKDVASRLKASLTRRVVVALEAARTGRLALCEGGVPISR